MNHADTAEFLSQYSETLFPNELLSKYEPLEKLSENSIGETFLVNNKESNTKCICKVYDKNSFDASKTDDNILENLHHDGLPQFIERFENELAVFVIREYVDGITMKQYCDDNDLSERDIIEISQKLCEILSYLHHQKQPVIHRDVKPSNIIIHDGCVSLIDFGIARRYNESSEADTVLFGTRQYAPPEQYGFAQTDVRSDIYSFGVLLRFMLTGNEKAWNNDKNIANKRLGSVVRKCTALDPDSRFSDIDAVGKAIHRSRPQARKIRTGIIIALCAVIIVACGFGGWNLNEYMNRDIWSEGNTPAFILSESEATEAVTYLNDKYNTDFFKVSGDIADMDYLRQMLVDIYGLSYDYAFNDPPAEQQWPEESETNFYPWGLHAPEHVAQDIVIYTAVKLFWPDVVTDWSSLKDDDGEYPGVRVAMNYAKKHGILDGANRPDDLTYTDIAFIMANAEKAR